MRQVLFSQGRVFIDKVPVPHIEPGRVLVQVDHSCISIGTEMAGLESSGLPLWKRAMKQPQNLAKVFDMVASQGISKTRDVMQQKLQAGNPTGYSASGVVVEVGDDIRDIYKGDLVACAGAQCAFHAEYINVPRNLVVPVPKTVSLAHACTVTLGAIAMQGVRRASPLLGETFVVIGLGVLGQLTAQILKANGCRVIGLDLDSDRVSLARSLGTDIGINAGSAPDVEQVFRLTDGIGADGVIITAATPSDEVISTAFRMCRKKGRAVLVGDVGLNLKRADFYEKELDFFISTSYGPGRYDRNYEEKNLDYPVAYVRWTENRNMAEYLRLVSEKRINVEPLISKVYDVGDAPAAYSSLNTDESKPLMILLKYPHNGVDVPLAHKIINTAAKLAKDKQIRIAIIGAGSFAKGTLLPILRSTGDSYYIQAIASRSGHNAQAMAKQYGAMYATTDYQRVLEDPDVDAVIVTTRHNLHAEMALQSLFVGKHVLVEKPMVLDRAELEMVTTFFAGKEAAPILLTGYNRRFSPYIHRIRELTTNRSNPMIVNYRMNAGYIPLDHWVHSEEGGGRNIGEACHIYDLFTCLTGSKVASVNACSLTPKTNYYSSRDNFIASMTFEDGSIATLTYTAVGSAKYPKEHMEVFVDGMVLVLNDYKQLTIFGSREKGISSKLVNKGQKAELEMFAESIRTGGEWPNPLWQQVQASEISFLVDDYLSRN